MHFHLLPTALLSLLIATYFTPLCAQYDDDPNIQRVRLEDLDYDVRSPKTQLPAPPPPPPPSPSRSLAPPQPPSLQRQLPQYEADATPTQLPPSSLPTLRRPIVFDDKRLLNYNSDANYINNNNVEKNEEQVQTPGHQHLSAGYPLKATSGAFVLLPPFVNKIEANHDNSDEEDNNDVDDSGTRDIAAEHNNNVGATSTIYQALHGANNNNNNNNNNKRIVAPSTLSATAAVSPIVSYIRNELAQHQPPPPPPPPPGAAAPAPTHFPRPPLPHPNYLEDNQLEGAQFDAATYHVSPNYVYLLPSAQPQIIYGPPSQMAVRRPAPTYEQPIQSNQLNYAPMRRPDAAVLPATAATLPYPPSFISITTSRPSSLEADDDYEYDNHNHNNNKHNFNKNTRDSLYGRQFRPSLQQLDTLPDLFATRHAKSLLDSYIPSWVVTQMLQQQRQQRYGYHTLAYPVSAYERAPLIKRELSSKLVKPLLPTPQQSVRKPNGQLTTSTEEQMLMTE